LNETSGGLFEYCLSHLQKEGAICTINQAQNNLARLQPLHAMTIHIPLNKNACPHVARQEAVLAWSYRTVAINNDSPKMKGPSFCSKFSQICTRVAKFRCIFAEFSLNNARVTSLSSPSLK
jgi:hypothetical protein